MLVQGLTNYPTFTWDEIIHIFMITARLATEHSLKVAIGYMEERWQSLYERLEACDPDVRPAAFMQYRDQGVLQRVISLLQKEQVTDTGGSSQKANFTRTLPLANTSWASSLSLVPVTSRPVS